MRRNAKRLETVRKEYFPARGYMIQASIMRHANQANDVFQVLYGKDEYRIAVTRMAVTEDGRIDYALAGSCCLTSTDCALMNRIWYNIVNRDISYDEIEKLFDSMEEE